MHIFAVNKVMFSFFIYYDAKHERLESFVPNHPNTLDTIQVGVHESIFPVIYAHRQNNFSKKECFDRIYEAPEARLV